MGLPQGRLHGWLRRAEGARPGLISSVNHPETEAAGAAGGFPRKQGWGQQRQQLLPVREVILGSSDPQVLLQSKLAKAA